MRKPARTALATRRADPFTTLFQRPFGSLIDQFFSDQLPELFTQDLLPRTNIAEEDKALTVSLEMPGLEQEDIDVRVENDHLIVRAERKSQVEDSDARWHRVEQRYGSLSRTIALPKGVQTDDIDAVYKSGILTLTIPKAEKATPTRIEVRGDKA